MLCKTLSVCYEKLRLAECKALWHYTDPELEFARSGQSSFCVHGRADFMGQGPISDVCLSQQPMMYERAK
jgi:hypothetical protein